MSVRGGRAGEPVEMPTPTHTSRTNRAAAAQAYIFDEGALTLQSNKGNAIAFQISVPLLAKIFAAAAALDADSIQARFCKHDRPAGRRFACLILLFSWLAPLLALRSLQRSQRPCACPGARQSRTGSRDASAGRACRCS